MANGYFDTNQQFVESFSVLEGVMVRIGDKFKVPEKVVLPIDLSLLKSSVTSATFDFSFEEKILQKAEEDRKQKTADQKRFENQNEITREGIIVIKNESTKNIISEEEENTHVEEGDDDSNNTELSLISMSDTAILEPTPIYTKPHIENTSDKIPKQFNFSEFEDSNVTPFELVELQTLDDINELKSVLQPDSVSKKSKKKSPNKSVKSDDQEPDFSIFEFQNEKINENFRNKKTEITTALLLQDMKSTSSSNANTNAVMPIQNLTVNSLAEYNLPTHAQAGVVFGPINKSYTGQNNANSSFRHMEFPQIQSSQSNIQYSNLTKTNSKSMPNLAETNLTSFDPASKSPQSNNQEMVVPTSRINNIMKQYQFTRFTNAETNNQQDEGNGTYEFCPVSYHGMLPSIHNLPKANSVSPTSSETSSQRCKNGMLVDKEKSQNHQRTFSSGEVSPSVIDQRNTSTLQSFSPSLIKEHELRNSKMTWLPDPTQSLNADETKLLYKIVGMGFPLPRSARAVQRFKDNEKEIIDSLVQIQQITDMGYDADDVEVILENFNCDTEKAVNYLQVVNKWKELGFPQQKIHDALKQTDRENENIFEYLTR